MAGYFKNLSTFRVLLLFFAALSAGSYIYEARIHSARAVPVRSGQAYETLLSCAEHFGEHLSDIEAATLDLALQYELLEDKASASQINRMLGHILDASPAPVLGMGILLPGERDAPEILAFLSRDRKPITDDLYRGAALMEAENRPRSPREVNLDRRLAWLLFSAPPTMEWDRFQVGLSVSLLDGDREGGQALTRAGVNWLLEIMERMAGTPGIFPVCVTPGQELLWLDEGRLFSSRDYPPGELPHGAILKNVAPFLQNTGGRLSDSFIRADIVGTGWQLLAANATEDAPPMVSLLIALGCVVAVIGEACVSSFRQAGQADGFGSAPGGGWLSNAYNLLFKYRLSNPEQERLDSELKVARNIQFSLVPDVFPPYSSWREFDLHAVLAPAREIGGDFYDFFMPDPDCIVVTVADVSGKGVPAALYMAAGRTAFRSLSRQADSPAALVRRLNEMLVNDNHSGRYITLATFFIDLASGRARYTIAGHPAPLWGHGGEVSFIDDPRGTIVGMRSDLDFPAGEMTLSPGDTLLLYTDGAPEARNGEGEELDYDTLKTSFTAIADAGTCRTLVQNMEGAIRNHSGGCEQSDDITLLAFRYWGPGGRASFESTTARTP